MLLSLSSCRQPAGRQLHSNWRQSGQSSPRSELGSSLIRANQLAGRTRKVNVTFAQSRRETEMNIRCVKAGESWSELHNSSSAARNPISDRKRCSLRGEIWIICCCWWRRNFRSGCIVTVAAIVGDPPAGSEPITLQLADARAGQPSEPAPAALGAALGLVAREFRSRPMPANQGRRARPTN